MSRLLVCLLFACLAVPAAAEPATDAPVVVTYFHRTLRCQTCLTIESLARYDVLDRLAADVEAGQLAWRLVDMEEKEHAARVEAYGLEGPTLVVTRHAGDGAVVWERLDRAWDLYGDVEAFDAYVLEAVGRFLDAASADEPAE